MTGSLRTAKSTLPILLMLPLLMLAGCASQKIVSRPILVCPKPEQPSAAISQIMRPNSTGLLKKADTWYTNSGQLLDSVTPK